MTAPFLSRRAMAAGLALALACHLPALSQTQMPAPVPAPEIQAKPPARITFLLVNDIDKMDGENKRGGFARVKGVVTAEKAKGGHVILAHAGDTISPCLLCGFDNGESMVELNNLLAPDVFAIGNHEFDFGRDNAFARVKQMTFPVLAANLRRADGSPLENTADTKMLEIGGYKVGFYGLTTEDTPTVSSPGDIKFRPAFDVAVEKNKELRAQGADLVVAVAHTDRETDFRMMEARAADLVLGGHDQDLRVVYDGRAAFAESYEQGYYVVAIDLDISSKVSEGKLAISFTPNFRIIDTADVVPDPAIAAKIKQLELVLSKELDAELGATEHALDSRRATVRSQEAAIGSLITDAQRAATNADVAILNGGGIRANREYPAGSRLTRRDILGELPFGNRTVVTELKGSDLKDALEQGVSQLGAAAGRFPQVSGITFSVDSRAAVGGRVSNLLVGGKAIEPAAIYRVATNDFMLRGGDGYLALTRGRVIVAPASGKLIANDVMAYIRKAGTVHVKPEGRIVIN